MTIDPSIHRVRAMGQSNSRGGMSLGTVVQTIFIILKLTGGIAWSWWWVMSPLWGISGLVVLIFWGYLSFKVSFNPFRWPRALRKRKLQRLVVRRTQVVGIKATSMLRKTPAMLEIGQQAGELLVRLDIQITKLSLKLGADDFITSEQLVKERLELIGGPL